MSVTKNDKEKNSKNEPIGKKDTPKATGEGETVAAKKRFRWTAVDSLILLMVLLVVAGAVVRGVLDRRPSHEKETAGPYYVDFAIEEIHPKVLGEIQPFDALYLYETGERLGYVGVYDDGTIALHTVVSPVSSARSVAAEGCMVCVEGVYQNGSLLVSGTNTYISPGAVLVLRTDQAVITVEITDIRIGY